MEFTKMSGTGNDFIVIDSFHQPVDIDYAQFARKYCARKVSVGADGVLVLGPGDSTVDFTYRIFNADGTEAEMCGNGARCAAAFAVEQSIAGEHMRFKTLAGIVEARVNPRDVSIRMTMPHGLKQNIAIMVEGREAVVHHVNTGVPHAVWFTSELEDFPVDAVGRAVRTHPFFSPAGTNVDFVQVTGPGGIRVRTYERGVEAETLACGTGAVASAIVSHATGRVGASPVRVSMPGGILTIDFTWMNGDYSDVWLTGEVSFVYTGTLVL
ncbi:MAG: diaminopimelate epimerase [Desulfomonilia bacterium]|jgi:diaminopimelate epimerase|nr:diaminopimelate epimerase [Deltaproteobacteria bacterium]MDX9761048.1 diaminopimelate epimerase [Desulfomonilia bacterium]HPW68208.1 diaminopimelate epimerase [Deltaproteobacteria bacterium]